MTRQHLPRKRHRDAQPDDRPRTRGLTWLRCCSAGRGQLGHVQPAQWGEDSAAEGPGVRDARILLPSHAHCSQQVQALGLPCSCPAATTPTGSRTAGGTEAPVGGHRLPRRIHTRTGAHAKANAAREGPTRAHPGPRASCTAPYRVAAPAKTMTAQRPTRRSARATTTREPIGRPGPD
jgi:hypothetical protein